MKFVAFERSKQGTGASRRLRNTGMTPGIVYGGSSEPKLIELPQNRVDLVFEVSEGDVTAVSATSLTVKSADGYVSTYSITDETIVVESGGQLQFLRVGTTTMLVGVASCSRVSLCSASARPMPSSMAKVGQLWLKLDPTLRRSRFASQTRAWV